MLAREPAIHNRRFCLQLIALSVEDFSSGYPRFSALTGTDASSFVCRRFSTLRARLLLQKQDQIAGLEQQLQHIDEAEPRSLFLGSLRRDTNPDRARILNEIDTALKDYGKKFARLRELKNQLERY